MLSDTIDLQDFLNEGANRSISPRNSKLESQFIDCKLSLCPYRQLKKYSASSLSSPIRHATDAILIRVIISRLVSPTVRNIPARADKSEAHSQIVPVFPKEQLGCLGPGFPGEVLGLSRKRNAFIKTNLCISHVVKVSECRSKIVEQHGLDDLSPRLPLVR